MTLFSNKIGIKVVESGAKWNKVVDINQFFCCIYDPWQTTWMAEGVWMMAVSCGRHSGQVIDDVYGEYNHTIDAKQADRPLEVQGSIG